MVEQRSDVPQKKPTQNTKNGMPKGTLQALQRTPDSDVLRPLRTKLAKDLAEGEQETVPEADRAAIEACFPGGQANGRGEERRRCQPRSRPLRSPAGKQKERN